MLKCLQVEQRICMKQSRRNEARNLGFCITPLLETELPRNILYSHCATISSQQCQLQAQTLFLHDKTGTLFSKLKNCFSSDTHMKEYEMSGMVTERRAEIYNQIQMDARDMINAVSNWPYV